MDEETISSEAILGGKIPALTLGRFALMRKCGCAILERPEAFDEPDEVLKALWALKTPYAEVLAAKDAEAIALEWGETMTPAEYIEDARGLMSALADFYSLFPGQKKTAGT